MKLSQHLNFNTLLIAAIGGLAWYFWHDVSGKLDTVPELVTKVAVMDERMKSLQENCVTESRLNDLLARANRKAASPKVTE